MPPPIHRLATPKRLSDLFISYNKVAAMRAPDAPIGCPRAMAPPFTLTLWAGILRSLKTPIDCDANASFTSNKSMSSIFSSDFFSSFFYRRYRTQTHDLRIYSA